MNSPLYLLGCVLVEDRGLRLVEILELYDGPKENRVDTHTGRERRPATTNRLRTRGFRHHRFRSFNPKLQETADCEY